MPVARCRFGLGSRHRHIEDVDEGGYLSNSILIWNSEVSEILMEFVKSNLVCLESRAVAAVSHGNSIVIFAGAVWSMNEIETARMIVLLDLVIFANDSANAYDPCHDLDHQLCPSAHRSHAKLLPSAGS